jgi:hypothetical protein
VLDTADSSFQTAGARVRRGTGDKSTRETDRWHTEAVSEGTHRTLCFRQRSQAKAFPILPSLASMVIMVIGGLGGEWVAEGECWVWGRAIMMPRLGT